MYFFLQQVLIHQDFIHKLFRQQNMTHPPCGILKQINVQ